MFEIDHRQWIVDDPSSSTSIVVDVGTGRPPWLQAQTTE